MILLGKAPASVSTKMISWPTSMIKLQVVESMGQYMAQVGSFRFPTSPIEREFLRESWIES